MSGFPDLRWLRRRGVSLVLLLGFLFMGLVAVEQARTIDSQRQLIHQLFQDSLELTAVRMQSHALHSRPHQ